MYPGPFLPVLDGPGGILSDYPAKRLSRGAGGRVPLLIGTVLDEGQSTFMLTSSMADGIPRQGPSSFHGTSLM